MSGGTQLPDHRATIEISPEAVAEWIGLAPGERPRLIDCREEDELAICQITGNEWLPLGLFSISREKLSAGNARGVVVYCHHGVRSLRAAQFLRAIGVENAFSMHGGIEAWSERVDPTVARY
ncbi:rhodanese [Luteolibacter yonseiensis]|uniref:Rhodanese n=1 Tax=Luteolibacter yonseiensis TaxID=1144680 RepID=A0A934R6X7_9BACT|nr:rhodanese-like domain-containing protein [Luteolibacter yonseiensis]MBK1816244.1 rhodanese [Luteolibacter yonseiensis]